MHDTQASATALLTARARARHQLIDEPKVFDDPVAVRIVGDEEAAALRDAPASSHDIMATVGRAALVARSRVAEDLLHEAVARGVSQYVVLGAGLDTFAYRNPYAVTQLRVFEVDHPATQQWKQQLLRKRHIPVPPSLRFVPVDFVSQPLGPALHGAGVRPDQAAWFSWLGVSMYLSPDDTMATLRTIAAFPRGSGVVFDVLYRPAAWDWPSHLMLQLLSRRYGQMGEPWIGFHDPDELVARLNAMGFRQVRLISRRELNERLFAGRSDGLRIRAERMGGIVVATV